MSGSGYTDHCPDCLWSRHVDVNPGDRASKCKGTMKPVKVEHDRNWFVIVYICQKCALEKKVKAAEGDNKELLFQLLSSSGGSTCA